MATLLFKVHRDDGELLAATRYAEDAAAMVALLGEGSTVRHLRRVVWTEGAEQQSASESYDAAAEVMRVRLERYEAARRESSAPRGGCPFAVYIDVGDKTLVTSRCELPANHAGEHRNARAEERAVLERATLPESEVA